MCISAMNSLVHVTIVPATALVSFSHRSVKKVMGLLLNADLIMDPECPLLEIQEVYRSETDVETCDEGFSWLALHKTAIMLRWCTKYGPYGLSNTGLSVYGNVVSRLSDQQIQDSEPSTVCLCIMT